MGLQVLAQAANQTGVFRGANAFEGAAGSKERQFAERDSLLRRASLLAQGMGEVRGEDFVDRS